MTKHTPGALRAATVIMNMAHTIETDYGQKTEEGIADLIDRETHAPEMLEALEEIIEGTRLHYDTIDVRKVAKAAIQAAKGEG